MTIEQKAKAYDEAIKIAKSKIKKDKDHILYEDDIIDIFSELKEGEDEKIRKELIEYLKRRARSGFNQEVRICNDAIAWLEKRGEQKPQGKSALEVWKDMRLEVYQQASGNRHEPNYSDDNTKMFSLTDIDEIFEKVAEKQGEQKSEEEVDNLHNYLYDEQNPADKVGNYDHKKVLKTIINEQNPAWSEEDERMFTLCASSVKTRYNDGLLTYNEYEQVSLWLKSLKDRLQPQPKQEWSEEDEYVFNKVLNWMLIVNPTSSIFEKLPKEQFIKRFKSLKEKYTWKPNDEQMEALEDVKLRMSLEGYGLCPLLQTLINDLKKLKDE